MKALKTIVLAGSLVGVASCMVGPDFKPPQGAVPVTWQNAQPPRATMQDLTQWWNTFNDAQMINLLATADANNHDVQMALIRIKEARAQARVAGSNLYPSLSASTGPSYGTNRGLHSAPAFSNSGRLAASWSLDIFGGDRRAIEAAEASLQATTYSEVNTRLFVRAQVAGAYCDWLQANEALRIAREQLDLQRKTLKITQDRHGVGFGTRLDVEQASAQVANTQASIPTLEGSVAIARNTLSTMLGVMNQNVQLRLPSASVVNFMPPLPNILPAELLRRRPDVLAAEQDLHAAVANVGVNVAQLYPKFSITTTLAGSSDNFWQTFTSKNVNFAAASAVSQWVIDGGRVLGNIQGAKASAERAKVQYDKTVLAAINDVESALIAYNRNIHALPSLLKARDSSKAAAELSLQLYTEGQADFLNVVTSQRSWLSAEDSVILTRQNVRRAIIQLATALGGGW